MQLTMTDWSRTEATNNGIIAVRISDQIMWLGSVYYFPSFHLNLLSCTKLHQQGVLATTARRRCSYHYIEEGNRYLASLELGNEEELYTVPIDVPKIQTVQREYF